jgi:protein DGCR14
MLKILSGVDASPLMTWGSIEGTPVHLDTDVVPGPGPTFKIPTVPRREELAHQLADKATRSTRERRKAAAVAARCASLHVVHASQSHCFL